MVRGIARGSEGRQGALLRYWRVGCSWGNAAVGETWVWLGIGVDRTSRVRHLTLRCCAAGAHTGIKFLTLAAFPIRGK